MTISSFRDRRDAGLHLAQALVKYGQHPETLVLALPRGGVPVAYEVALALALPLDVLVVRKLGMPGDEEVAMGAIAAPNVCVLNQPLIDGLRIKPETIEAVWQREQKELERRQQNYRQGRAPLQLAGKTVILVDDGLATGATMRAAVQSVHQQQAGRIVVAVPVAAPDSCQQLQGEVDELVAVLMPAVFISVGSWYEHFDQTSDQEVCELLVKAEGTG